MINPDSFMKDSVEANRIKWLFRGVILKREPKIKTWNIKGEPTFIVIDNAFYIELSFKDPNPGDGVETFTCTLKGEILLPKGYEYTGSDTYAYRVCCIVRKLLVRRYTKCVTVDQLPQYACSTSKEMSLLRALSVAALKGDIALKT